MIAVSSQGCRERVLDPRRPPDRAPAGAALKLLGSINCAPEIAKTLIGPLLPVGDVGKILEDIRLKCQRGRVEGILVEDPIKIVEGFDQRDSGLVKLISLRQKMAEYSVHGSEVA